MNELQSPWQAWCDGTAAPNPGRIGLGIILVAPDGSRHECSRRPARHGCNNEAELLALSELLALASEKGASRLRVTVDSRVVTDYVGGHLHTDIACLAALIAQIKSQLATFENVELRWRPSRENADADRLARAALGLPEKWKHEKKRRRR